tara:strand:- start:33 stop:551 length:519 start_codon:yes stop_codon:yes gene_type:complete
MPGTPHTAPRHDNPSKRRLPMMNQDINDRLDRLERENKTLKTAGAGILGLGGLAALVMGLSSSVPVDPESSSTVCREIWGERIVLRDSSGRDRMTFDAYSTKLPTLTIKDDKGKAMASVAFPDDGGMKFNTYKNGKPTPATFSVGTDGSVQLAPKKSKAEQTKETSSEPGID